MDVGNDPIPTCVTSGVDSDPVRAVATLRQAVALKYLGGSGVEVGAGDRPFSLPAGAHAIYGDIRDSAGLEQFFKTTKIQPGQTIDAQTFANIADASLDFVISAHVIEHLRDPVGSIVHALRVLRPGGIHLLVVPDLRFTFDRRRPQTTVEHSLRDFSDGGGGTCEQAYEEHLRYVHPELTGEELPEAEIRRQAAASAERWEECDIHFHAWRRDGFEARLAAIAEIVTFRVEETVSVVNENIFVLRKPAQPPA